MGLVQTTLRGSNIRQEIPGETYDLLKDYSKKSDDRGVFCKFFKTISIKK